MGNIVNDRTRFIQMILNLNKIFNLNRNIVE
jgi:hypothetical protein